MREFLILLGACFLCVSNPSFAAELTCRIENGGGVIGQRDQSTGQFSPLNQKALTGKTKRLIAKAAQRIRLLKVQLATLKGKKGKFSASQRASIRTAIRSEKQKVTRLQQTLRGVALCKKASLDNLPPGISSYVVVPELALDGARIVQVPGNLWIQSTGDVSVDGQLLAQGANGQSIVIESGGAITARGKVSAGNGTQGLSVSSTRTNFTGEAGVSGGGVLLRGEQISLTGSARLVAGNGGAGRSLTALLDESGESSLRIRAIKINAGHGGRGGDVVLDAGEGVLEISPSPDGQPLLIVGNGGDGGSARIFSFGSKPVVKSISARGGDGGDSGLPRFAAGALTGLTYTETVLAGPVFFGPDQIMPPGGRVLNLDFASVSIFGGGIAGHGGTTQIGKPPQAAAAALTSLYAETRSRNRVLSATAESGDSCVKPTGTRGRDCNPGKGARGGNGFFCPGDGGSVTCADDLRDGKGTQPGGSAIVEGGDGGNLRALLSLSTTLLSDKAEFGLGLNISAIVSVNSYCGRGGIGGLAQAFAGHGGRLGGNGGEARATGGNGGNAHFTPNGADINVTATVGGRGGTADAFGGDGMAGVSCCSPVPKSGQDGGTGGAAFARGGDSGDGTYRQSAGSARALSGDAGKGGDGNGPGSSGQVGQVQAQVGNVGDGLFTITEDPTRVEDTGEGSTDGNECPVVGPTPTPTSPGTTPGQCSIGRYTGNNGCGFGTFESFENRSNGQVRTAALGTGSTQVQFLCETTPDCPCVVSGITIFSVEDHTCCVRCQGGLITVSCRNPQGGTCVEQFQPQ